MKKNLLKVEVGNTVLLYRPLKGRRTDGVVSELVGYVKKGKTYWY